MGLGKRHSLRVPPATVDYADENEREEGGEARSHTAREKDRENQPGPAKGAQRRLISCLQLNSIEPLPDPSKGGRE
jgi:hypothetical protein